MTDFSHGSCSAVVKKLTPRETEVLRLMANGSATKQIADALAIAEGTVKVYRERIYSKMGVNGLAQAARVATMARVI